MAQQLVVYEGKLTDRERELIEKNSRKDNALARMTQRAENLEKHGISAGGVMAGALLHTWVRRQGEGGKPPTITAGVPLLPIIDILTIIAGGAAYLAGEEEIGLGTAFLGVGGLTAELVIQANEYLSKP